MAIMDSPLAETKTILGTCARKKEDMSSYKEGQTHQLADKLEAEGFTPEHITKLGQFGNLAGIKSILEGTAVIRPTAEDASRVVTINETTIAVSLASSPRIPFFVKPYIESDFISNSWVIVEKKRDGELYVNDRRVCMYLSKRQGNDKEEPTGYKIRDELAKRPTLHANILDALFDNQHLIPETWGYDCEGNARFIFFWCTIYGHANGASVGCLSVIGTKWIRTDFTLSSSWRRFFYAAVLEK